MAQHDQNHHHDHNHSHSHDDFDPGTLYKQEWVQDGVRKIQKFVKENVSWLGLDANKEQRFLDYACGHGTVSLALVDSCPHTQFRGIDSHPNQVQRYNNEAEKNLRGSHERMFAVVGDLPSQSSELDGGEWHDFDVVVMSMALHHCPEPVSILVALKKRLREGGTLVLIEGIKIPVPTGSAAKEESSSGGMIETVGGQKIWPGFNGQSLRQMLEQAGFRPESIEVRDMGMSFRVPADMVQREAGEDMELIAAKAVAC